jgi:hypothetical protein
VIEVSDEQRRARLAARHALTPASRLSSPVEVADALVALHSTEASSVYLSVAARSSCSLDDVTAALVDDRTLVRQLAMRRTLWALSPARLPDVLGSVSARVAGAEERRLVKDVEAVGVADGATWLVEAEAAVLAHLRTAGPGATPAVRDGVPALDLRVLTGGPAHGRMQPVATRVLTLLGAKGQIVRGMAEGRWQTPRLAWTPMADWVGAITPSPERDAYRRLVGDWLRQYGPGTLDDIVWWFGTTKTAVRHALADLEAVEVALDGGSVGWLMPDDLDPVADPGPWVALLPALDPTTMGWRGRDFYLSPELRPLVLDTAGNAAPTLWWSGRVVGTWVQDPDGTVIAVPAVALPDDAMALVATATERLSGWLDGQLVTSVYAERLRRLEPLP